MYHIGQQVMCVHAFKQRFATITYPRFMQIYTVRAYCPVWKKFPAILLVEIVNRDYIFRFGGIGEPSWGERCFRPLEKLVDEERTIVRTSIPAGAWRKINS